MVAMRGAGSRVAMRATCWMGWTVLMLAFWVGAAAAADSDGAPPDRLRVTGIVPPPGEGLRDRLTVIFDREIAPIQGAAPATSAPLTFRPPLAGTFEYGPNFVTFRPASTSADNQVIAAEINPLLKSSDGKLVDDSQRRFLIATKSFRTTAFWALEDSVHRTVLALEFSLPVKAAEVGKLLEIHDADDRPITLAGTEAGTNNQTVRLQFAPGVKWPAKVRVPEGVPDATGNLHTTEVANYSYSPNQTLEVVDMGLNTESAEAQSVTIQLLGKIQAADLTKHLTVTDLSTTATRPLKFDVTGTFPGTRTATLGEQSVTRFQTTFHVANPANIKIRVAIAAGLKSEDGRSLGSPYSREFSRQTSLQVGSDRWETWGRDGIRLVMYLSSEGTVTEKDLAAHLTLSPPLKRMQIAKNYGTSFEIRGDWQINQDYTVTITPGLPYGSWAKTTQPIERSVHTPEKVRPFVGFAKSDKYYLPRRRDIGVVLETRGVTNVGLTLYRVFPSNLPFAADSWTNANGNWNFSEDSAERLSTRSVQISSSQSVARTTTTLPLASLMPADSRGVFYLRANGQSDDDETAPGEVLLLTDMGMLAHWQDKQLVVFVHDLFTLDPLRGVALTAYSQKHQVLATGKTGADGIAVLDGLDSERLGEPYLVVADTGRDTTFLRLGGGSDEDKPERSPFSQDLSPYDAERADGYLYGDRDLYRPGDTVHLRWIVRRRYGDALAQVPLKITVTKPNGKNLLSEPITLSDWGTGNRDIETQQSYPTGRYVAELTMPGGKQPVGSYTFQVEEFVPNRIEAKLEVPNPIWVGNGKPNEILLTARNLFGTPADGRTAEAKVVLQRGFSFEQWKAYRFDNDEKLTLSAIDLGQVQTDKDGKARFEFTHTAPAEIRSPLAARVQGKVLELGGRAVNAAATATYFPSDLCLGIAMENGDARGEVRVHAVAVRPDGTAAADVDKVTMTLEREDWNYSVRRYSAYMEPYWSSRFEEVEKREVDLHEGQGTAVFSPPAYGYYRIRVHSPRTQQMSSLRFSSYYGYCRVMRADEPSLIKIKLDRETYDVGDEVTAHIESPFDGKALVVIQGEKIREARLVTVTDGVGDFRFRATRENYPNVWIEATVVHAISKAHRQVYPFSSFTAVAVKVQDPERHIQVTLPGLPEEVHPSRPCEVEIQTNDMKGHPVSAEVTLAAVDEGIHGIRGYTNPDPLGFFGRTRKPDYNRAHYYDRVAYDFDEPAPGGGEGDEGEMGKRLGRGATNWIRTVALWSGAVRTDAKGHATVKLDVPDYNGQLRLVAVAANATASGAEAKEMYVRQPHMLRTSMPRFLLPGDTASCSAVVFNTTDQACKARLTWTCDGTLTATQGTADLVIAPKGEAHAFAPVTARLAIGQGRIVWHADVTDTDGNAIETLKEEDPLPVNEPGAFESFNELRVLKAGEETEVRNTRFMEDAMAELHLTVSAVPSLRLQDALKHLVGYPYGCVEQTTSKLMPVYLARKNAALLESALGKNMNLDAMVQSGVDRLFSMQTASGGLAFWPGGDTPYDYGSVYAFHCLTLMHNGRDVPMSADNYALLKEYVRRLATNWQDNSTSSLYTRAYAVYTLALNGDKQAIDMIARFDSLNLPRPARYLLAAALARNTHDVDRVRLYMNSNPSTPWKDREQDGTLSSDIRNQAVELLAQIEIGAPAEELAPRADALIRYLEQTGFYTTHETAFVVAALQDYLDRFTTRAGQPNATITAPDGTEGHLTGREVYTVEHKGAGSHFTVRNTGAVDLFLNVTSRGVPLKPNTDPVTKGMSVKRRFLTREGQARVGATFKQGETAIVELQIACERQAKNVIVADLLPAGFEVDNPRLNSGAGAGVPLPHEAAQPTHLELRDDRLVLVYDQLSGGAGTSAASNHYFYYAVNCVTPGEYRQPAVTAECMYDPAVRAASAASTVEVQAPGQ